MSPIAQTQHWGPGALLCPVNLDLSLILSEDKVMCVSLQPLSEIGVDYLAQVGWGLVD